MLTNLRDEIPQSPLQDNNYIIWLRLLSLKMAALLNRLRVSKINLNKMN